MIKTHVLLFLIAIVQLAAAQQAASLPDSLENVTYADLSDWFYSTKNNKKAGWRYANTWLEKARLEHNTEQMVYAYKALLYCSEIGDRQTYADSMFVVAQDSGDNTLLAVAALSRGIEYYERKQHAKALDSFILADTYASRTKDRYLHYKIKYTIAQTKYYLGYYHEAIALLKACVAYFKVENDSAYLNSLHSLGLCYNHIGKYAWCSDVNAAGIKFCNDFGNREMEMYFLHSEGVNQYGKRNYTEALQKLAATIPFLRAKNDYANETVARFYIGKSYWSLNKKKEAFSFFREVNDAFVAHRYIRPDLREAFEILKDDAKRQGNRDLQLLYTDRLLEIDAILQKDYRYLSEKILRKYNVKQLQAEKIDLEKNNHVAYAAIAVLALVLIVGGYRQYRIKKRYREKYDEYRKRENAPVVVPVVKDLQESDIGISPDVLAGILKKLDQFEKKKIYREKDMDLKKLAAKLDTNPRYATKILSHYRGKGTREYISDLKIAYIIELLETQKKYRNYTNPALAEEAGFSTAQKFTNEFIERVGTSPTFFIKELKKELEKDGG